MNTRTLASYGGPFQNEEPVVDPVSEVDAAFYNRKACDTAQLTGATGFTWFSFLTMTGSGSVSASNVSVSGVWGAGTPQKPAVVKSSTGIYVLTWPATFDDELIPVANMEAVAETQNVVFTFASGLNVQGAVDGRARATTLASNVVTINILNTSNALSDLAGTAIISGYLR